MNSYDAPEQVPTGRHGWDLIQAQDILGEIAESQRFLTIAYMLRREALIEIDPDFELLFDCYWNSDVPAKLQAATELIESVRKTLS
jgi:hypothetical protein